VYDDLYQQAWEWLESEGVDVPGALADAAAAGAAKTWRALGARDHATDLSFALKRAEKALDFERRGLEAGCGGFTAAGVAAAAEKVRHLKAELGETLVNDPKLVEAARRRADGWA
jgi:hypothetical protein